MTTALPLLPRRTGRTGRTVRSLLWRYRPALVAVLVAVAAWSVLGALRPAPPETAPVVAASHDLPAGHEITAGDLAVLALAPDVVPPGAFTRPEDLVGHRIAHPAGDGVPLVPGDLVENGAWAAAGPDELVVPVRLADPVVAGLIPTATPIQLVAATGSGPTLLTRDARLVARIEDATAPSGVLGTPGTGNSLLLLAVPADVATLVLDAGAGGTLTVALGAGD
ncbi:SAF domain-containing protein [Serinibacter arcticus]|uniref:SAF domain-containing protein n=1 Tax=Serinibacter arcticus TaxID=1655435 RepID=A0A4Z1DW39_9MICO|nr:SAF domain-containing protein [Serinibacter arcticus]TGO03795.1 hypothetical protein SERN_2995 [Serinibacter arcticus]